MTVTLSKLSDALICFGFGFGVGDADGLADVGVAEGVEAASAAGSSLLHPKSSSDDASPRTTATLTGEEGTGEGYRVKQWVRCER